MQPRVINSFNKLPRKVTLCCFLSGGRQRSEALLYILREALTAFEIKFWMHGLDYVYKRRFALYVCVCSSYPAAPANICPLRAACFDIYLLVARCGVYICVCWLAQHAQVVGEKLKSESGKKYKNISAWWNHHVSKSTDTQPGGHVCSRSFGLTTKSACAVSAFAVCSGTAGCFCWDGERTRGPSEIHQNRRLANLIRWFPLELIKISSGPLFRWNLKLALSSTLKGSLPLLWVWFEMSACAHLKQTNSPPRAWWYSACVNFISCIFPRNAVILNYFWMREFVKIKISQLRMYGSLGV